MENHKNINITKLNEYKIKIHQQIEQGENVRTQGDTI